MKPNMTEAELIYQANLATCCLNMVTIHATMKDGSEFRCMFYPWECLDGAASVKALGAASIGVNVPLVRDAWYWGFQWGHCKRPRACTPKIDVSRLEPPR